MTILASLIILVLLAPAMFILGFALLFPVGMGELLRSLVYQTPVDAGGLALYLTLSAVFLALAVACFRKLRTGEQARSLNSGSGIH